MKWLSYGWTVLVGLVTLLIAVAVVSAFSTQFEKVVVDLLVLTYVSTRSAVMFQGWIALERSKLDRNRFLELMRAVGEKKYDAEEMQEQLTEMDETIDSSMAKGYISAVFLSLVSLVALLSLLGSLAN